MTYTPEQLNKIKDAVYKITDARSILQDVTNDMKKNNQNSDIDDIGRIIQEIDEMSDDSLNSFLKTL